MSELILHAYDASPFTQRVLRMLAFKDLDWRFVETPMMPPKDDLLALTGGYRGTPVLQVGADVYIDSQLIARKLELLYPRPSLYPGVDRGLAHALVKWSDVFFRAGLQIVLATSADSWPEAFRKDREQLFPDVDFAAARAGLDHARAQFRAHASLLEEQLSDGRAFIAGGLPGLADAQAHPFVAMLRGAAPAIAAELMDDLTHLCAWQQRVAELGEGTRTPITASEALAEALAADPDVRTEIDPHDAQGLKADMRVRVSPDDTRRGEVEGVVVIATPAKIAIAREHPRVGRVVVHFPRLGYRVTRAS